MQADAFRKQIVEGKVPSISFLYGEEALLIRETLDLIRRKLSGGNKASLDEEVFYGAESDASAILQSARTLSLFGGRKLILVKEIERMADPEKECLLEYVGTPDPQITLILTSVKPDMRKRFFAHLQKRVPCVRFYHPYDIRGTEKWIRSYLKQKGFGVDSRAARALCEGHGRELQVIKNELDKLILYKGKEGEIEFSDVTRVSGQSQEFNVFELADAVGERDLERALGIYARLIQEGIPPVAILGALASKFRKLWMGKSLEEKGYSGSEILRSLRLSYRGDRFLKQLQGFREDELEAFYPLLLEIDEAVKGGRGDPAILMEIMMQRVCRRGLHSRSQTVHLDREA